MSSVWEFFSTSTEARNFGCSEMFTDNGLLSHPTPIPSDSIVLVVSLKNPFAFADGNFFGLFNLGKDCCLDDWSRDSLPLRCQIQLFNS